MTRFAVRVWVTWALLFCGVGQGRAAAVTFTFSIGGNTGSGTVDATPSGLPSDDGLHASTGTLTLTGGSFAGTYSLVAGGPGPTSQTLVGTLLTRWDNLVYPANDAGSGANTGQAGFGPLSNTSYLDEGGLVFSAGGTFINIFGTGNNSYELDVLRSKGISSFTGDSFNLTSPTATPEPASLTLLGIGAAGLIACSWRQRRRAAA